MHVITLSMTEITDLGSQKMNTTEDSTSQNAQRSDVGDLFDYGASLDEIFHEPSVSSRPNESKPSHSGDTSGLGLGLDEEVKVSRKRKPIAKLDESR